MKVADEYIINNSNAVITLVIIHNAKFCTVINDDVNLNFYLARYIEVWVYTTFVAGL